MNKTELENEFSSTLIKQYEERILNTWESKQTYSIKKFDKNKPFYYCLEMFPYPSGRIHMGHVRNYTIGDIISRFKRLQGFQVLHPIGWDSFGLPAENAAIKNNQPPAEWTFSNIDNMRVQLKRLGLSYDWQREIYTCKPDYYKFNQEMFVEMFKQGLAYKKEASVNWCQECNTVLANEQVVDGCCWRHEDLEVQEKNLSQWFFKITDFAQELLDGHEKLKEGWPSKVIAMQKNWIGRSTGVEVTFDLELAGSLDIFTTRVDTIFGVRYMAVAPEHDLLNTITDPKYKTQVEAFQNKVKKMSSLERQNPDLKEGVFTGLYAINPFNQEKVPIYTANFVLISYGSGAVMAVPAHDQRDYEFAQKYGIEIKQVIAIEDGHQDLKTEALTEKGKLINSGKYTDLTSAQAIEAMAADLESKGSGSKKIQYRLRDWLLSRQRYWGTPIPIIYCDDCGIVPETNLPVVLPEEVEFKGASSPLANMPEFLNCNCPQCGKAAKRETDTMDTFVDSSWYYARFLSPWSQAHAIEKEDTWMLPIDYYIGGIEHANMHLLYARFFTKVMKRFGLHDCDEPFSNLLTQGMVIKDGAKMSKSLGNVVDPDSLIEKYGADTVRLFTLFAAPPEKDLDWSESGVEGGYRFLKRLHRFYTDFNQDIQYLVESPKVLISEDSSQVLKSVHKTLLAVENDIDRLSFNTGIARLMELLNALYAHFLIEGQAKSLENDYEKSVLSFAMSSFFTMLFPYAPFLALESLSQMGLESEASLCWIKGNENYIEDETMTIVFQVNGKLRDKLEVDKNLDKVSILKMARDLDKLKPYFEDKQMVKEIYVPNKLVNFVVK